MYYTYVCIYIYSSEYCTVIKLLDASLAFSHGQARSFGFCMSLETAKLCSALCFEIHKHLRILFSPVPLSLPQQ